MIIGRDQYADLQYMSHNMRFTAGKFCRVTRRVTTRDNFFPAGTASGRLLPQTCHTKRWKTATEMWHTATLLPIVLGASAFSYSLNLIPLRFSVKIGEMVEQIEYGAFEAVHAPESVTLLVLSR